MEFLISGISGQLGTVALLALAGHLLYGYAFVPESCNGQQAETLWPHEVCA